MGELTQSFAQVTNAINQTKQQNLNRDVAQANFSFRQQENDLANRQFDANQKQREFDNQLNRAEKAFDMGVALLPLVPPGSREGLMNEMNSAYSQVTGKSYTPEQFMQYKDTRAQLHALAKEPEKAAEVVRRFEQQALPGDPNVQKLKNEFLTSEYHNLKDDSGSMVGLYKLGRVTSQSNYDRILSGPDKDEALALQAKKENGQIEVVPDDRFLAYGQAANRDARLSVLDPKVAEKLIKLELGTLDPSQLSGEQELDQLIHTNNYFTGMDRLDAMLQAGIVPPMSLYREVQRSAALSGNKELPSPILSAQDHEKMLASKARRDHLTKRNELISAQVNETGTRMAKTMEEIERIGAQVDNIRQDTANDKIAGESALLATQAQRRQMEATAPQKLQRIAEIDQELEDIDKVQGNPVALGEFGQEEAEAMQDREDLLKLEKQVMEDEIAFAGNKNPALVFERREALRASAELARAKMEELKAQLASNGKELNGLQLSRLASVDQKRQQDQATFQQEQDALRVAQQGLREGVDFNDPQAVQGLADKLGANAPLNLVRKKAGLSETLGEGGDGDRTFKASYTGEDGVPREITLQKDSGAPGGFKAVQIENPDKPGEMITMSAEKSPLVQIGSAGEREKLLQNKDIAGQTTDLISRFEKVGRKIVGPFDQFIANTFKRPLGLVEADRLEYEKEVNTLAGVYRHELFGSALTEAEIKSALGFIPDVNDYENDHLAKLKVMQKTSKRLVGMREEAMGIRKQKLATVSNEDRFNELKKLGATDEEALSVMVEEGR